MASGTEEETQRKTEKEGEGFSRNGGGKRVKGYQVARGFSPVTGPSILNRRL